MNLKQKLEYHYKVFDASQISPDPLQFLHQYNDEKDIEVMGFIAAVFAYGNVKQIISTLNKIVDIADDKPYQFAAGFNTNKERLIQKEIKHRFYSEEDVVALFYILQNVIEKHGSLKNLFVKFYNPAELNLKTAISKFSHHLLEEGRAISGRKVTRGVRFMFSLPELGSACKRTNLFLRWMVRKDELDFGLWNEIPASKLVIPVDTHVARICRELKLTTRKNVSWKMAEEITENLKKFDPHDPVKYDFAICHIGMRKLPF